MLAPLSARQASRPTSPGQAKSRLDRPGWYTELLGNLDVDLDLPEREFDHLALVVWKPFKGLANRFHGSEPGQVDIGAGANQAVKCLAPPFAQHSPSVAPQDVEAASVCDPTQICP